MVWSPLSAVCLWIGAIIMAFETGLRGAPNVRIRLPRWLASEKWNLVPGILISIAIILKLFPSLESLAPIQWATAKIANEATPSAPTALASTGFSDQFLVNLKWDLLTLPRPCV